MFLSVVLVVFFFFFNQAAFCLLFCNSFDQAGAEEEKGIHQAGNQTRRSPRSYFLLWRAESVRSGESL